MPFHIFSRDWNNELISKVSTLQPLVFQISAKIIRSFSKELSALVYSLYVTTLISAPANQKNITRLHGIEGEVPQVVIQFLLLLGVS